jgi:hypothetical protein
MFVLFNQFQNSHRSGINAAVNDETISHTIFVDSWTANSVDLSYALFPYLSNGLSASIQLVVFNESSNHNTYFQSPAEFFISQDLQVTNTQLQEINFFL